jgi:hypothetical protein
MHTISVFLSSVSLFLLKETNMHTISVLIYHGMRNLSVRIVHLLAVDSGHARVSVLYILAHTVYTLLDAELIGFQNMLKLDSIRLKTQADMMLHIREYFSQRGTRDSRLKGIAPTGQISAGSLLQSTQNHKVSFSSVNACVIYNY